jgi:hypothetical protein
MTALAYIANVTHGPHRAHGHGDPTYVGNFHVVGYVHRFGRYDLDVMAHRREFVTIRLHRGSVLEPRGLRLRRQMLVSIDGFFVRGVFEADRVVLFESGPRVRRRSSARTANGRKL